MNIFVINLSGDVERRQFQKQQLSELGLDYKILNAISTDDINKETYKKHYFIIHSIDIYIPFLLVIKEISIKKK